MFHFELMSVFKGFFAMLWRNKRWVAFFLVVLIGWAIYGYKHFYGKQGGNQPFVSTDYEVITWDVEKTLNLQGTTQFANAQKLTFVNKGRVTSVRTKIWANVKKWDVLATITTDDLDRKVESAKKDLKNKQLELKKILDKSDQKLELLKAQAAYDLLVMQKQTLPSEQQLDDQTKKFDIEEAERQIREKEKNLKEAETDYAQLLSGKAGATNADLAVSKNVRTRNTSMEKLVRAFREEANALQSTLDNFDAVMKLTDQYKGEEMNTYIGAKNVALIAQSKEQFRKVYAYKARLNDLYTEFSKIPVGQLTENKILSGYTVFKELGADLRNRWKINYEMFNASIESEGSLSKSQIDGYMNPFWAPLEKLGYDYIDKYTSAVETLAWLKDSDTTIEDAADKVEKLKIELENLKLALQKKKLESEVNQKQQLVSTAELEKKIKDAKVDLEKAREWSTEKDEIQRVQNEIDNAQFELTTLMKQYDEYKIIANFDGRVTKLDMQVGDSIDTNSTNDNQKYIYVETPDLLEVKIEVDQLDIVKIQQGMKVQVSVGAFPDQVYSWVFSEIDTMPEGNSYKAKVVFQKNNPEEKILGGMSATVKVTLEEAKGKLVVPNPALADNELWEKIVRLKKGEQRIDQVVEVGIADEMNTVILSGLKLGDTIKGFYMNDISAGNAGIGSMGWPKDGNITTEADGSMSYEYAM